MWDRVGKWQHHIFKDQKALAGFGIIDVLLLVCRQVEPFRKDFPVPGRLIEQRNKIAVFQNVFDLRGGKEHRSHDVLSILNIQFFVFPHSISMTTETVI